MAEIKTATRRRTFRLDPVPADNNPPADWPLRTGFGSGVIIDAKGVVLTNYHVVEAPMKSWWNLPTRQFPATDVKTDEQSDLCRAADQGRP